MLNSFNLPQQLTEILRLIKISKLKFEFEKDHQKMRPYQTRNNEEKNK